MPSICHASRRDSSTCGPLSRGTVTLTALVAVLIAFQVRSQDLVRTFCDGSDPILVCTEDTLEIVFDRDLANHIAEYREFVPETRIESRVVLDIVSTPIFAWTVAVRHDSRFLSLDAADLTIEGTDSVDMVADDGFVYHGLAGNRAGDTGYFVAIVLSAMGDDFVPPARQSVFRATYTLVADPGLEGTRLEPVHNELNVLPFGPPVATQFVIKGTGAQSRLVVDGLVRRAKAPSFVRGDTDQDGRVNLTDGVFVLKYLFTGGRTPGCLDAADTDDSGSLQLVDGVRVLRFLFQDAEPPPPPGPRSCGVDPTDDGLGCKTSRCG